MWNHKRHKIAKTILSRKNNAGAITVPDLKIYYRILVNKTMWDWHKNRHVDKGNNIEGPHMSVHNHIDSHLIFDKGSRKISWQVKGVCNEWCWENCISTCRIMKSDPYLSHCLKTNSK